MAEASVLFFPSSRAGQGGTLGWFAACGILPFDLEAGRKDPEVLKSFAPSRTIRPDPILCVLSDLPVVDPSGRKLFILPSPIFPDQNTLALTHENFPLSRAPFGCWFHLCRRYDEVRFA